jgi:hypothetical protein
METAGRGTLSVLGFRVYTKPYTRVWKKMKVTNYNG